MMRILSDRHLEFPPPADANSEGLLAVGGDLRPERLLAAYRAGVFPWYSAGQPLLWWCPDPRAVLLPANLRVSRSLRRALSSQRFRISVDHAFREVMLACAAPRTGQRGTWITDEMLDAYCELHRRGVAHSVECWQETRLVGGLYGISLGSAFFGESMFSRVTDASKVALVSLVRALAPRGLSLVDCQIPSAHLARLGAREVPRGEFLAQLATALRHPGIPTPWHMVAQ